MVPEGQKNSGGMNLSEDKQEKRKLVVSFLRQGSKIAEAIQYGLKPQFLCFQVDKGFSLEPFVEGFSEIYYPIGLKGQIPYSPYIITPELLERIISPNFRPNFPSLYKRVYDEFDTFLDIESHYKQLETAFTFETYQQHKFNSIGYLYHLGPQDCGKSRALEVQNELAYRPLYGLEMPVANIFNYIGTREEGLCTILEDEAQSLNNLKKRTKLAIYRGGYRKGANCPRIIEGGSKDRNQKFYKTFCSKAFSGYYFPKNNAFKSRCIPVPFVAGDPKKDEILDEDRKRMASLKVELLVWRMTNYFEQLPNLELSLKGRVKEVWKCKILSVIGTPAETTMLAMAEAFQKQKSKNLHDSLEAHVIKTVIYLAQYYDWLEIRFTELWHCLLRALEVEFVDDYAKNSVEVTLLGYAISKKRVGGILGSILHGEQNLRRGLGRTWKFDRERLVKLAQKFAITAEEVKELRDNVNDVKEVNVVKDVKEKTIENECNNDNFWEELVKDSATT